MTSPYASVALMISLLGSPWVMAEAEMSADELDVWLEDDSEARALAVNVGQLVFLRPPADRSRLYTDNLLTISEQSSETGWVGLKQCHYNLDPVSKVDIVYTYIQMQGLRIDSSQGIEQARVVDQSVQLENVARHASLCIRADVRVFYHIADQSYVLRNGPYYRKFLDGYYPYNVTMQVNYPVQLMEFKQINPRPQMGFEVMHTAGEVKVDAWFDGALKTEIQFELKH